MSRLDSFAVLKADPRTARETRGWSVVYEGFGPLAAQMFAPFLPVDVILCAFDGAEVDTHARAPRPNGLGAKVFTYERAKGVRHASIGLFDRFFLDDHADAIAAAIAAAPGRKVAIPFASNDAIESFLFRRAPDVFLGQNPAVVRAHFEDKMRLAVHAGEMGVPLPPAARVALAGDLAYAPLAGAYPAGFVMQVAFSQQGAGTEFVFAREDFDRVIESIRAATGETFPRTQIKITPFMNGPSLNCTGVVVRGAVALSPANLQLVGDPRFVDPVVESGTETWAPSGIAFLGDDLFVAVRGQYMGSDFSYPMEPAVRDEVLAIARRIGEWLGRHGYRGNFGIDLLTRMEGTRIAEIAVSEINARLVGESQYLADFEAVEGIVPLTWFHLAEFLQWDVTPREVEAYDAALRPVRGAALMVYTREKGIFRAAGGLRPGVYRIPEPPVETARLERLRDGWTFSDIRADVGRPRHRPPALRRPGDLALLPHDARIGRRSGRSAPDLRPLGRRRPGRRAGDRPRSDRAPVALSRIARSFCSGLAGGFDRNTQSVKSRKRQSSV